MVMWIVLGALVVIVVGFLIISSLWDKKKRKRQKLMIIERKNAAKTNIGRVAIWVVAVIKETDLQVKKFVPSIGKYKMSDLNNIARTELKKIKNSEEYKSILVDPDFQKLFDKHLDQLLRTNPNMWTKHEDATIKFWNQHITTALTDEQKKKEYMIFETEIKEKIKDLYD